MTPEAARAMYRRQMQAHGEVVTFRRVVANAAPIEISVRARVMGYGLSELSGGIGIGDRRIIITAEDAETASLPVPFRKGSDAFLVRSNRLVVQSVDDSTRRIGDTLVAYEIRASGA